jgi:hypothetical protein
MVRCAGPFLSSVVDEGRFGANASKKIYRYFHVSSQTDMMKVTSEEAATWDSCVRGI